MDNSNNTNEEIIKEDYNSIPVIYCKNCLSLKIMILDKDVNYCDKCGCTDTESIDIASWEEMYYKKYGKPFNK